MRLRTLMIGLVAASMGEAISASPADADCQIVHCHWECHPVPGGMRCQDRCLRRCWHPAPQYAPPAYVPPPAPNYAVTPHYAYGAPAQGGSPDAAVIALVVAILVAALIGSITTSTNTTTEIEAQTDAVGLSAGAARDLTGEAADKATEIDAFIETEARTHHERGRAAADEEWTRG